ncbi:hypothetical protein ACHAWF_016095 [Thalassiosira exigua]
MSFYLDDDADDDRQASSQTCPNCSGDSFYNDPVTGALICSECYTQSQTATQEELDYDEGIGLAATGVGKKRYSLAGEGGGARRGRHPSEYDRSRALPDVESCCLAFQWLLWDASKRASKLAGIREGNSYGNSGFYSYEDEDERPSILERTVKDIWFKYLHAWTEAAQVFSAKYPEMRVSFRDCFLEDIRKSHLMRHLSVTVGRKVEEEMLEDMQKKYREKQYQSDGVADDSSSSSESGLSSFNDVKSESEFDDASHSTGSKSSGRNRKRKRQPYLTIAQMCKHVFPANPRRYPNGIYQMHPHHAALKIRPSLTLLLSILQLALTHLRTGVAPHHLTTWVANGQLPHALNGFALLPSRMKERVDMVKKFFARSFIPPASAVANLTDLLATACNWYDNGALETSIVTESAVKGSADSVATDKTSMTVDGSCHQKSLYNVPLLTARMIQDFGFDQRVFNNAMSLMGVANGSAQNDPAVKADSPTGSRSAVDQSTESNITSNVLPPPLGRASKDTLHTPLHVAAVLVVACKFCPGWETWQITNLHARASDTVSRQKPSEAFVPWNEAQFQLLGSGPTLNHYINFLEETAFKSLEPPSKAVQFFQSLQRDVFAPPSSEKRRVMTMGKTDARHKKTRIRPNCILSGAPNPNDELPERHDQYLEANNIGRYASYQYTMHRGKKMPGIKPYHPHYCRLLEYMCYVIEETSAGKLHDMVEEIEEELLSLNSVNAIPRNLPEREYTKVAKTGHVGIKSE